MKPRSEDDIYRELQQRLSVDPSPNFVGRIRTTVANQPNYSLPAFLIAAGVSVTAVLLIATVVHFARPATDDIAYSRPAQHAVAEPAPIPDPVVKTPSAPARSETHILRPTKTRAQRVSPEPSFQAMVAPEDVQAFERLVRSTEDGTIALSFDETNRKLTMAELTIAPITTEPLAISEQQGVVQ